MEWIKFSDRMPKKDLRVLIYDPRDYSYRLGIFYREKGIVIVKWSGMQSCIPNPKDSPYYWISIKPPKEVMREYDRVAKE